MSDNDQTMTWSIRCYRALLKAYPPRFRAEYGAAMESAFCAMARPDAQQGSGSSLRFAWAVVLRELPRTVLRERLAETAENLSERWADGRLGAAVRFALVAGPLLFIWVAIVSFSSTRDEVACGTAWIFALAGALAFSRGRGMAVLALAVLAASASVPVLIAASLLTPWPIEMPLSFLPVIVAVACTAALILAVYTRLVFEGLRLRGSVLAAA